MSQKQPDMGSTVSPWYKELNGLILKRYAEDCERMRPFLESAQPVCKNTKCEEKTLLDVLRDIASIEFKDCPYYYGNTYKMELGDSCFKDSKKRPFREIEKVPDTGVITSFLKDTAELRQIVQDEAFELFKRTKVVRYKERGNKADNWDVMALGSLRYAVRDWTDANVVLKDLKAYGKVNGFKIRIS